MGYGGALIWTGLFRNLKDRYPDKKIILKYLRAPKDFLLNHTHPDHIIYKNNPDIYAIYDQFAWFFVKHRYNSSNAIVINMNDPGYNYADSDSDEKICYRTGKHAMQIACDMHGIEDAELKPRISLTEDEIQRANSVLDEHHLRPGSYICLEPHSKTSFTVNKAWFWDRWQELVCLLTEYFQDNSLDIRFVQVGVKTNEILDGVIDLTGRTTFRETAGVLQNSVTFISYMGGLIHLAKAVNLRNVVLISAWEPYELAAYPDDINLYSHVECQNCGLKQSCPNDRKCMRNITVQDVYDAILTLLRENQI